MRKSDLEAKVLRLVERVESRQPLEDSTVELKSEWPSPASKAARRLAGHANSAGGEQILWLIGIDEVRGVTGAPYEELASWYDQVQSCFDSRMAPRLACEINVPVGDKTVVALLFETDRAPYVVKNPAFGKEEGECIELEVPWRQATRVRSANRGELLSILVEGQSLPDCEVLAVELHAIDQKRSASVEALFAWELKARLYMTPRSDKRVVFPFHRATVSLEFEGGDKIDFERARMGHDELRENNFIQRTSVTRRMSSTITGTSSEVLLDGPGLVKLAARLIVDTADEASRLRELGRFRDRAECTCLLSPVGVATPLTLRVSLVREESTTMSGFWRMPSGSYIPSE